MTKSTANCAQRRKIVENCRRHHLSEVAWTVGGKQKVHKKIDLVGEKRRLKEEDASKKKKRAEGKVTLKKASLQRRKEKSETGDSQEIKGKKVVRRKHKKGPSGNTDKGSQKMKNQRTWSTNDPHQR